MASSKRRFITAALPYANGPLHFGHLAGVYLPADVYFRHSRLSGVESVYISGSDEYGVAIMLNADKASRPYQSYVNHWHGEHAQLFADYDIGFSFFGRTTSPSHVPNAQDFFLRIHRAGYLKEKTERQAFCKNDSMFLPDRFLMGVCPHCSFPDARGDECPNCGRWLDTTDLKDPYCAVCKKKDLRWDESSQWYIDLPKLAPKIRAWLESQKSWKENVRNYAISLLENIPERAVTRNLNWGVDLPAAFASPGKKIYVWFEAPIGYLTNLKDWAASSGKSFEEFWKEDRAEMIHFIGKDNIIFHTIIWPGMLMAAGERLPDNVPANMFLNLMKKQFSKSSGWYVDATQAVKDFGIDRLRYYLISVIPEAQDTSFDWQIFHDRVNAELVNKIANLFNRVGTQIKKHFEGVLPKELFENGVADLSGAHKEVLASLEKFEINTALTRIVQLSEEANKFLDDVKPWNVIKEDKEKAKVLFAKASTYMVSIAALLQPFLPSYSARLLRGFSIPADREDLHAELYRSGALALLKKEGLCIQADADFVIPRIETAKVAEEIAKLQTLKSV